MMNLGFGYRRRQSGPSESGWSADARANWRDLVGVACVVLIGSLLTFAPQVDAVTPTPNNFKKISVGNDRFYNYDFVERDHVFSSKVDWPMSVVFKDNSTVDKVKSKVEGWSNQFDSYSLNQQWAHFSNNSGDDWNWDPDGGKKTPFCPGTNSFRNWSPHYRVYGYAGSGRESLYNSTWGYWNMASTHKDWHECGAGKEFFEAAEATENLLGNEVDENTAVRRDTVWFGNKEPYRRDGNRTWSGNGYATTIRIP